MFKLCGTFLSNVQCTTEREVRAKRCNVPLEQCHVKYGCILFAVNNIEIGSQRYSIDRNTDRAFEERLVLELGYQLQPNGNYIQSHKHITALQHQPYCELTLNRAPYLKENHVFRVKGNIKTYFIKIWANNVIDLVPSASTARKKLLTPKVAVRKLTKPIILK